MINNLKFKNSDEKNLISIILNNAYNKKEYESFFEFDLNINLNDEIKNHFDDFFKRNGFKGITFSNNGFILWK